MKDKEFVKKEAEKDAIKLYENAKVVYKGQASEYAIHFYNKLSELRANS